MGTPDSIAIKYVIICGPFSAKYMSVVKGFIKKCDSDQTYRIRIRTFTSMSSLLLGASSSRAGHFFVICHICPPILKVIYINNLKLFVEIFWNYGSSALTVNPEPILDAFVELFMARDVQLHVDIPTMYQHPKDR